MTVSKIQSWWSANKKQLFDIRNIGLYIFTIILLAITWSTAKTIQSNYQLQKQISVLHQQNQVLSLENQNAGLQNQFYQTNQYLDLSARQNLGLAAPGEQVILVPQNVALKYIDPAIVKTQSSSSQAPDNRSKVIKNIESWRDFLLGRRPVE